MEFQHQSVRDNEVQLTEKPEDDEKVLAVVTRAQAGEEIARDKDRSLGIEFPFDKELFGKPGKPRAHLT